MAIKWKILKHLKKIKLQVAAHDLEACLIKF